MQNKGLVKLFAILFGLVSIYQLSFTFRANQIEDKANEIAISRVAETEDEYLAKRGEVARQYLDSLTNENVFNILIADHTYKEVKDKELKKGLDLQGGINVILQIKVRDILKGLANNSKDPIFNKALDDAEELQKNSQNTYLEDFFVAFDELKGGDTKLASPDIFANRTLSDEIKFDMSDDDVQPILKRKIDESIVSAFEVLRKRIDQFGVTQPNIQRLGTSGRILVELPGARDVERATGLLQSTAQLEFWDCYKGEQFQGILAQANEVLKDIVKPEQEEAQEEEAESDDAADQQIEDLLGDEVENEDSALGNNPIFDLIKGTGYRGGPVVAQFDIKDVTTIKEYLNMPQVRSLLPAEQRNVKFLFGKQEGNSEIVDLYALIGNNDNVPELSGGVITDARQSYDAYGKPSVSMQMNNKGAKIWESMTGKAYSQQSQIAIVLDDIVYSAPGVTSGPIAGGNSEISGSFSLNEAIDLANVLRAGKLPARADIIQKEVVGPSLGQEAIDSGLMSFLIALGLVLLWMIFYYGKAGVFADTALLLNLLLIFGILSGLGAVLTLPGIAGIVLTIGMSVDANVLIFERVREELFKGKDQKTAVKDGFANALSSILDANITTGLTALILFVFGTGPIKGFATTLLIGILTSLFTAIFITRLLVDWYVGKGNKLDFSTSITKNLFRNINIEFLKKRKVSYIVSGAILLLSLGSLFTNGLDQGVDFVGGRTYQVRFAQDVNPTEVTSTLVDAFGSADAKTFGDANQLKITTKHKVNETSAEVDEEIRKSLFTSLQQYLPSGLSYEDFIGDDENKQVGLMKDYKVSPTIADDIKKASYWAIIGSLIVVFLYILLRFKRWQFSLGAVAAVFHDVLIVLGIFSLAYKFMPFNMEIDQAFIAAILTVIGYSLNDTVVVFDRIREFFNDHASWKFDRTVNSALSSTLSRTLNTSLTTLVVLLAIFIFGGDSIRGFMFALIVGVIVGTYSSLFIATPIMYDSIKKKDDKGLEKKVKEEKKKK